MANSVELTPELRAQIIEMRDQLNTRIVQMRAEMKGIGENARILGGVRWGLETLLGEASPELVLKDASFKFDMSRLGKIKD